MWYRSTIALTVLALALHQENGPVTNRDGRRAKRTTPTLLTVTRGTEHGCGLDAAGRAFCWGSNRLGQLGTDDPSSRPSVAPVSVATTETFVAISAGANHTCALTGGGVAYCWGLNLTAELGQAIAANECGQFACNRRPVRVMTSVRFDTISAGFGHTCALSEGRAFCWGRNDQGQLGTSHADDSCDGIACNVAPTRVMGVDRFTSIAAGGDHTCGLAAGAAYCWGSNAYGQLGVDPSVKRTARPTRMPLNEPVASIEARGLRTCATTTSGKRNCWGQEATLSFRAEARNRDRPDRAAPPNRPYRVRCRVSVAECAMPTFTIAGGAGAIHVVDLREESPSPSGALPIVFVHGMVGHTGFWNAALAASADRRRAVAVDLRGHGNSAPASDGKYDVPSCADDVLAVFDALGLDTAVLVGHSYGALVAIEAAARRPDIVRRLVLVDPPGDFTTVSADVRNGQIAPFLAALDTAQWRNAIEASFEGALKGGTTTSAAAVHARLATMPRDTMRSMSHSMFDYAPAAALRRYLAEPDRSVHAILAPVNAWPFSLHVLVPEVQTSVVPDVGHWIMLDAPERFVAELEKAIAGT